MKGETKQKLYAEDRVETLTVSVGEVFHKVNRLNSILDDIEKKIIGDIPVDECTQPEPHGIKSYVYSTGVALDDAITIAERIKDIL